MKLPNSFLPYKPLEHPRLFKMDCKRDDQLLHLCRENIIRATEESVKEDINYINEIFENNKMYKVSPNDIKHFIKKITNEKLVEMGYIDLGNYFAYDPKAAANLDWLYHFARRVAIAGVFTLRPTNPK